MINQVKAELLKIRSTRTTMGLLIGLIALALLFTILTGTLSPTSQVSTAHDQISLLSFGSIAGVFAALAGVVGGVWSVPRPGARSTGSVVVLLKTALTRWNGSGSGAEFRPGDNKVAPPKA